MTFSITPDAVASLARRLYGEPNRGLSTARELRFGRRGSLVVVPSRGVWRDHEAGVGGGVLAMMVHAGEADTLAEAALELERGGDLKPGSRADRNGSVQNTDRVRKKAVAAALWRASTPIEGKAGAIYLRTARAVRAPLQGASLRFLAAAPVRPYANPGATCPAMIARVVDRTGEPIGAHLTFLRPDGLSKADLASPRKMVGAVGGGHVPLIGGATLIVAEGVESALSAWDAATTGGGLDADGLGCVAALSAGGMAGLHWPQATTALLIAPDTDANGAGQAAAQALAGRAWAAGLDVRFIRPPPGFSDWNDAARAETVVS